MSFYGIDVTKTSFTTYFLPPGNSSVTQVKPFPFTFDFNAYYAQPTVLLSADPATPLIRLFYRNTSHLFRTRAMNLTTTGVEPVFRHLRGGTGVGNNGGCAGEMGLSGN
ncbi:MAG: hypothetical protein WDM78_14660 [Puia sp.]